MVLTKNKRNIPVGNHIIRYIPWGKLRRNGNDEVIGILGEAFHLREIDKGKLSVTWREYFDGDDEKLLLQAIQTLRKTKLPITPKSGFAVGKINEIQTACLKFKSKIRVVHSPSSDNKAHTSVLGLPEENFELFELLATEAWAELMLNRDIPD